MPKLEWEELTKSEQEDAAYGFGCGCATGVVLLGATAFGVGLMFLAFLQAVGLGIVASVLGGVLGSWWGVRSAARQIKANREANDA